jgi:hypothetical protein
MDNFDDATRDRGSCQMIEFVGTVNVYFISCSSRNNRKENSKYVAFQIK